MKNSQHRTPLRGDASVWAFSRRVFTEGMRDGVPIALGYFAVSFSLALPPATPGLPRCRDFWQAFSTTLLPENTRLFR